MEICEAAWEKLKPRNRFLRPSYIARGEPLSPIIDLIRFIQMNWTVSHSKYPFLVLCTLLPKWRKLKLGATAYMSAIRARQVCCCRTWRLNTAGTGICFYGICGARQ